MLCLLLTHSLEIISHYLKLVCEFFVVTSYVLRRILRRAVRFASEKLNAKPGTLAALVDAAIFILVSAMLIECYKMLTLIIIINTLIP